MAALFRSSGAEWRGGALKPILGETLGSMDRAKTAMLKATSSPDRDSLDSWLSALWLACSKAHRSDEDLAATLEIYSRYLKGYPADLIKDALEGWPRRKGGKWFPAAAEIIELVQPAAAKRARMSDAVQTWGRPGWARREINAIRADLEDVKSGHRGWGELSGLTGSELRAAYPEYQRKAQATLDQLQAMVEAG